MNDPAFKDFAAAVRRMQASQPANGTVPVP
jgi:hypothetical protein